MIVLFFIDQNYTTINGRALEPQILSWVTIVGGFTLLLGVVSIVRVNFAAVQRRKPGWGYKLVTLISIFIMAIPAVLPSNLSTLFGTQTGSIYDWLFNYIDAPMMSTMFAMLAFYIASAAFRAFRARNAEATLLLVTAVLVMLWRIPMGELLLKNIHETIPDLINSYIMNGANLAVQRGIIVGAALGAAAMSLRIMLGIERTYMGK
jgi:VanZ family protein